MAKSSKVAPFLVKKGIFTQTYSTAGDVALPVYIPISFIKY